MRSRSFAAAKTYPGGTGDLVVRFDNPNRLNLSITDLSSAGPVTLDPSGDASACAVSVDQQALDRVVGYVTDHASGPNPADVGSTTVVTGAVAMGSRAADSCQGVDLLVPLTAHGTSTNAAATGNTTL